MVDYMIFIKKTKKKLASKKLLLEANYYFINRLNKS